MIYIIIYLLFRLSRPTKKDFINFVRQWEGGKSRATTDTASHNVAPGSGGVHTNKGITWTTYLGSAKSCGYTPSTADFLKMSDERWLQIFNKQFWNPVHADRLMIKDPAIAFFVCQFAWGSGLGGAKAQLKKYQINEMGRSPETWDDIANNFLLDVVPAAIRFDSLIEFKKNYFRSLHQPANLKGWLNRTEDFRKKFGVF